MTDFTKYIRSVPDFPKPGVLFYDITTLMKNPEGFRLALDELTSVVKAWEPSLILGIESRGFIFGAPLADRLHAGLVIARKPGKLPSRTVSSEYDLEYGKDSLEIHEDAIKPGDRVVIVDDLIATGGTLQAASHLVEELGGEVAGIAAVIDLSFLPWREKLSRYPVKYLVSYDSE
ncbi:MAG TPA: adenine phosphoribosyltransferase [candidate division Zixibacteria bacterium]|nr:adenine phosphoribosyltransferase [candidate division Zixibacteria bacterium]